VFDRQYVVGIILIEEPHDVIFAMGVPLAAEVERVPNNPG